VARCACTLGEGRYAPDRRTGGPSRPARYPPWYGGVPARSSRAPRWLAAPAPSVRGGTRPIAAQAAHLDPHEPAPVKGAGPARSSRAHPGWLAAPAPSVRGGTRPIAALAAHLDPHGTPLGTGGCRRGVLGHPGGSLRLHPRGEGRYAPDRRAGGPSRPARDPPWYGGVPARSARAHPGWLVAPAPSCAPICRPRPPPGGGGGGCVGGCALPAWSNGTSSGYQHAPRPLPTTHTPAQRRGGALPGGRVRLPVFQGARLRQFAHALDPLYPTPSSTGGGP